ncbi:hypothetical protein ACHAXT_002540 [Thalassiosira profunda]
MRRRVCRAIVVLAAAAAAALPSASCFSMHPSISVAPRKRSSGFSNCIRQPARVGYAGISTIEIASIQHGSASPTSLRASTLLSALPSASATDVVRTVAGLALARTISKRGLQKQSLSKSGALSAFIVASLSLSTSWRNGITLLAFYWTSSKLTRVGSKIKGKLEEGATEGGERGAMQVLACSLIAVVCACIRRVFVGRDGPLFLGGLLGDQLTLAYVAFFACCAGDTWASELGVLSKSYPRLVIKPWKEVPPGTNGGVSLVGLGASAAGGTLMGLMHGLFVPGGIASLLPAPPSPFSAISVVQFRREVLVLGAVGFLGGLGGSLLDSLLGATVQATYYDDEAKKIAKKAGSTASKVGGWAFLSNEMVNVVSTALSALFAAMATKALLSWT